MSSQQPFAVRVAVYGTEYNTNNRYFYRTLIGHIREPLALACSQAINEVPSLQITVRWGSPEHEWLMQPCELALEYNCGDGTGWHEPVGGRFVSLSWAYDYVAGTSVSITAPGLAWLMSRFVTLEGTGGYSEMLQGGMIRDWSGGISAGSVMLIALSDATARRTLPVNIFITTFTNEEDTKGRPWVKRSFQWRVGGSILDVLNSLVGQGMADWWTDGVNLCMTRGLSDYDLRTAPPSPKARLIFQRDITALHVSADWSAMMHRSYIYGYEGKHLLTYAPDASDWITGDTPMPWGCFETVVHNSNLGYISGRSTTQYTLPIYQGERPRLDLTYELNLGGGGPIPHVDYKPGDFVTAPHPSGGEQLMRVRQVTLQVGADGALRGNLILQDLHHERLRAREDWVKYRLESKNV